MIYTIEENAIPKNAKDAIKFGITLFKRKIWSFCWLNEIKLLNSSGDWLDISIRVIKKIVTEWFQKQNEFTKKLKAPKQLC